LVDSIEPAIVYVVFWDESNDCVRGHHVSYLGTFHEEFHEEYAVAVGFTEQMFLKHFNGHWGKKALCLLANVKT
jgi:hypothetical protein